MRPPKILIIQSNRIRVHCCAITCCATNANATVLSIVNPKKNMQLFFWCFCAVFRCRRLTFLFISSVSANTRQCRVDGRFRLPTRASLLIIWPFSRPKCYTSQTTLRISFVSIEGHWENDPQQFLGNGLIFDYVLGCCIFFWGGLLFYPFGFFSQSPKSKAETNKKFKQLIEAPLHLSQVAVRLAVSWLRRWWIAAPVIDKAFPRFF